VLKVPVKIPLRYVGREGGAFPKWRYVMISLIIKRNDLKRCGHTAYQSETGCLIMVFDGYDAGYFIARSIVAATGYHILEERDGPFDGTIEIDTDLPMALYERFCGEED
jgi:hypothetical protein